jgi:hypothetical protein
MGIHKGVSPKGDTGALSEVASVQADRQSKTLKLLRDAIATLRARHEKYFSEYLSSKEKVEKVQNQIRQLEDRILLLEQGQMEF